MSAGRFSRLAFGGGAEGERLAHEALCEHEAALIAGARVRVTRGNPVGAVGTIVDREAPGRARYVDTGDGLTWTIETRDLEVQS